MSCDCNTKKKTDSTLILSDEQIIFSFLKKKYNQAYIEALSETIDIFKKSNPFIIRHIISSEQINFPYPTAPIDKPQPLPKDIPGGGKPDPTDPTDPTGGLGDPTDNGNPGGGGSGEPCDMSEPQLQCMAQCEAMGKCMGNALIDPTTCTLVSCPCFACDMERESRW
jgi:hypothetical protein